MVGGISIYIHSHPFFSEKEALVWKEGTTKLLQALEQGGRSGIIWHSVEEEALREYREIV